MVWYCPKREKCWLRLQCEWVCVCVCVCACVLVAQLCPTLCDPMDCRLPGSSVHEILQARILEWVAIPFSSRCSWPRDWILSLLHCRQILYHLSHQGRPRLYYLYPKMKKKKILQKAASKMAPMDSTCLYSQLCRVLFPEEVVSDQWNISALRRCHLTEVELIYIVVPSAVQQSDTVLHV